MARFHFAQSAQAARGLAAQSAAAAERRRYRRVSTLVLRVTIDGVRYKSRDWSLGGFRLAAGPTNKAVGEHVTGTVRIGLAGLSGPFAAEVVRQDEEGSVAFRFIDISSRVFARLVEATES